MTTHQVIIPNKVLCIAQYCLMIVSLLYQTKQKPERGLNKRIKRKKMKATLQVNSNTNGTLKMKKENNNLRNVLTGLFLGFIALVSMSFTTDDTTKVVDTVTKTKIQTQDSCCVVSITNSRLVITGKNFAKDAKFSVNTISLEEMIVKSFEKLKIIEIRITDNKMDINFRASERINTEMAVAFRKTLTNQAIEADSQLSENLMRSAFAPAYSKNLLSEMELSDGSLDEMLYKEADLQAKTTAYKTGLSTQLALADEHIDQMLSMSAIKNIELNSIEDADRLMDAQIQKTVMGNINKFLAYDADLKMDDLINNN